MGGFPHYFYILLDVIAEEDLVLRAQIEVLGEFLHNVFGHAPLTEDQ